jgi:type VI secretion system protein ImpL
VPCIRLVAGHFPFARGALRDASLEDFARLFAPKAGFDQAFAQLIGARVDTSSDTWEVRGPGPGPQAADVERFRAAARIRDVFFRRGGMRPAIELKFRPLDMDQEIDRFQLEVDGQIVSYAHGPVETTLVRWPGPQAGSARIELTPASATDPVEFSGPWALFRLLDNAAVQDAGSPGRFRVVFGAAGHQATFEVESDSGANPFRLRELEHFDCPLPGP